MDKDEFFDLRKPIDELLGSNKNKGFKSNNKIYRRVFNRTSRESRAIDRFGDSYFYSSSEDETKSISITLPKSLIEEVNNYCKKKNVTRSRLIKKVLEYSLNLKKEE
jgi:hypothetical protein